MILAHQRLRPKAASCVNQNPAKCVLAHKIESASDRRNCFFRRNTQAVGSSSRQSKKHRRMLKKTNRTLFAALITLSLIGQGATAIASGCSAGHAASADTRQGLTDDELKDSIVAGAGLRVRPVLMTACATIAGLIPILMGSGTGSEVMSRLTTPMVGGMISAVLSTLLILPAVYYLWRR